MRAKDILYLVADGAKVRIVENSLEVLYDGVVKNVEELIQHKDLGQKEVVVMFGCNDKIVMMVQ